jgi:hypothetical protein
MTINVLFSGMELHVTKGRGVLEFEVGLIITTEMPH